MHFENIFQFVPLFMNQNGFDFLKKKSAMKKSAKAKPGKYHPA